MSSGVRALFEEGENCWRVEMASRLSVIVDADAYFSAARAAMLKARRRIFMIGWDFDARVDLDRTSDEVEGPRDLGHLLPWLIDRTPELEIYLLRWGTGAIKTILKRGTIISTLRWIRYANIHIRLDAHHPATSSHHQKIVVIDDCLAFCGGIDMLADRWDTREHRDDDERRVIDGGTPYRPWHDATTALTGAAARRLGELCCDRWQRSGAERPAPVEATEADCWPDRLKADFSEISVAISRTIPRMEDQKPAHEIEQLYIDLIASAKRHIYAESQYFASRRIARAMARRLEEPDGPEIVIVNPLSAEGWPESLAMDTARARLVQALRSCRYADRFGMYHPVTTGGDPIYVHAKILIVDGQVLRLGSSNMNNRSMRLDTECDISVHATPDQVGERRRIANIQSGLLGEHLGVIGEEFDRCLGETGSLIGAIEILRRGGGKSLRPYEVPDLSAVERWLANNEILDPEAPDEIFEPPEESRLFRARTNLLNRLLRR